jgi:hypothetical protein
MMGSRLHRHASRQLIRMKSAVGPSPCPKRKKQVDAFTIKAHWKVVNALFIALICPKAHQGLFFEFGGEFVGPPA